jgi:alpha-1,6-mannosyltransferase
VRRLDSRSHWWDARPWQTNGVLGVLGLALVGFTRQLVVEYDPQHHYMIGYDGVAGWQLALYVAAVLVLLVKPGNVNRWTLPIVLAVGILCRLVVLFPEPALSSDVYRYAWDGVVQHAGINPYRYVPGDAALAFLREPNQDLYDSMNRRDYAHTIYPPGAQILFYLITFISPTMTAMKTAVVLFEGLTMLGLVKLLRHLGVRREWSILYAWFPMLIWEFGGSGHLDSMVMAFMVMALLFRYRRQPVLTGVFLGLAVLTKLYPLVLFPALYRRGDWKMPATLAAMMVAFYGVYLSAGTMVFGFLGGYVQEEGMATGTRYFLLDLVQHVRGLAGVGNGAYLVFAGLVFASLTVWAWRSGCQPQSARDAFLKPAFGLALALMLLFSPHYPWYVAWLVPFFVLMPGLTVLTYLGGFFFLCTTDLATGFGPKQYLLNEILYGSVAIALIIELSARRIPAIRHWTQWYADHDRLAPDFEHATRTL